MIFFRRVVSQEARLFLHVFNFDFDLIMCWLFYLLFNGGLFHWNIHNWNRKILVSLRHSIIRSSSKLDVLYFLRLNLKIFLFRLLLLPLDFINHFSGSLTQLFLDSHLLFSTLSLFRHLRIVRHPLIFNSISFYLFNFLFLIFIYSVFFNLIDLNIYDLFRLEFFLFPYLIWLGFYDFGNFLIWYSFFRPLI